MHPSSTLWQRLSTISSFSCRYEDGLSGRSSQGLGAVSTSFESSEMILFTETGKWIAGPSKGINFTNRYRWTLSQETQLVIEQLRYDPQNPTVLGKFNLIAERWELEEAHLCGSDTYIGELVFKESKIKLIWKISGPRKQLLLNTEYE